MPTKTFFNLPESKREKLMEAVRNEFSRVPFDEVSINKIIRAAEIPRGSFYQYFKDKQDTLHYLLSDYHRIIFDHARESLSVNHGDLFMMILDVYDFSCSFVTKADNHLFFRNLFSDIRVNFDFYTTRKDEDSFGNFVKCLSPDINMSELDIREENDLENIFSVLLLLLVESLTQTFFDITCCDNARASYVARLALLKRGFLKKDCAK